MKKTIWYAGHECEFKSEVEDIMEAQALLNWYRAKGDVACATHYNGKHQIYVSYKEVNKNDRSKTHY